MTKVRRVANRMLALSSAGALVASLFTVVGLAVTGVTLLTAAPASAVTITPPVTETFAGSGPTGYAEVQLQTDFVAPTSVNEGATFTITDTGGSQVVPTSNSGVPVNYISGLQNLIPVSQYLNNSGTLSSLNASIVASSVPTGLTWSYTSPTGTTSTGPYDVVLCTTSGQSGCTATAPSSTFLGETPLPYLELSTGTSQFAAGGTLTLPSVSWQMTASNAGGQAIEPTMSEFDTNANVTISGTALNVALEAYPSVTFTGSPTTAPAYNWQPLSATNIIGPSLTVTTPPPYNIPPTGSLTINVAGADWPAAATSANLTWSGCPTGAACSDTGTATITSGTLSGSIPLSLNEQTSSTQSSFTLTLTATGNNSPATVLTTTISVNPFQSFVAACTASNPTPQGSSLPTGEVGCQINQHIVATVIGTVLSISEVTTGPNPNNETVGLSPVTLGTGTGTNNQQFDQAQGLLNTVVVSDDRGTLAGWTVTGQLAGNFTNSTQVGPAIDNVIPADFLTWDPNIALETPGTLPADNSNTPGCPDQTPPPAGFLSCTGPSGLPVPLSGTAQGTAGSAGVNGTAAGTGGVSSTPAEATPGAITVLNNSDTSPVAGVAKTLCSTNGLTGGGGGFLCGAGLSLAIPPYVAAGTYTATLNIVVIGF
jgi:hypothetical protein